MWFEIFSLCCSMLIEQLIDIKKMRTVNMKFTTDPLNEVFSFEQQIAQKILQIKNESSYCQRRSLHGFQISHFICNRFCCQLWLWSIQNHTRDSWKKLGIWADALFFGQIVHFDEIWSDVLHRTWFAKCILFLCFFFHPETNNKW